MKKCVLATSNLGKLREFEHLFCNSNIEIIRQSDLGISDAEETGKTFIENAILKARHAAMSSGLPALADDSGLVIPALRGEPGIYSARYAGKHGDAEGCIDKVLLNMADIPKAERRANFHCCLVLLRHAEDPTPIVCEADWYGEILFERRGDRGFGYDPIFYIPEEQQTAAELDSAKKARICHRGLAIQKLLEEISRLDYNAF